MRTNAARRRKDGKASRGLADRTVLVLCGRRASKCMPSVPWSAGLCAGAERPPPPPLLMPPPPPPPPPPLVRTSVCDGVPSGGRPRRTAGGERAHASAAAAAPSGVTGPAASPLSHSRSRHSHSVVLLSLVLSSALTHSLLFFVVCLFFSFLRYFSRALLLVWW